MSFEMVNSAGGDAAAAVLAETEEWQRIMALDAEKVLDVYLDIKSPHAYLAVRPSLEVARDYRVRVNFLPYALEIANDGKEALELLESKSYSILLTDCHMPKMDGFELTKTIRETEKGQDGRLPVIAITASVMKEEIDQCFTAGMDDYLPKPLEMPKLKAMLKKWMPEVAVCKEAPAVQEEFPQPADAKKENAEGPIDPSALEEIFGDDEDTLREILLDFVEPAQGIVREIEDAYEAKSATAVGAAAHKLKSSSRTVGANALADLCAELEAAGKSDDWDTIETHVPHLRGLAQAATDYIKAY